MLGEVIKYYLWSDGIYKGADQFYLPIMTTGPAERWNVMKRWLEALLIIFFGNFYQQGLSGYYMAITSDFLQGTFFAISLNPTICFYFFLIIQ